MRLVRCPACQTVFRLQPEQLRAHGGMVRCGHCFTLFDARENFVDAAARTPATDVHARPAPHTPASNPPTPAETPSPATPSHAETLFVLEDADERLAKPTATPASSTPRQNDSAGFASDTVTTDSTAGRHSDTSIDPLDFGVPNDFHAHGSSDAPRPAPRSPVDDHAWQDLARPAPSPLLRRQRRGGSNDALGPDSPRIGPPQTAYWPSLDEPEPEPTPLRSKPETPAEAAEREALERAQRMRERMNSIVVQDRSDDTGRIEPRFNPHARTTAELANERAAQWAIEAQPVATPPEPADTDEREAAPAYAAPPHNTDDDDAPDDDSASRYAPVATPAASAGSRWLQGLAIGMLLGLLGTQSAYLFRDDITRQWPELRPIYLEACARLGCDLPLPKDAGLIEIETSDLEIEPGRPARYTLNAVVRNRARFPQQHPHLELTLTDSRDRPVVRRVLAPNEWLADTTALAGGLGPTSSHPVRLSFETSGVGNAVGYRIYAFFP
ncbi:MAG: zinc-ribbon domain-containing protein [Zoogloeaceae bacterium]|nr:zinc-ribbon domain-containing protein [Zoogloeaceae bacterium]